MRDFDFWQIVPFEDMNRAYIISSDDKKGSKVQRGKSKVGSFSVSNFELLRMFKKYTDKQYATFDWQWDKECERPFISFTEGDAYASTT